MPRGRHRHSPPLHRLLPPTTVAGVSLVCAAGPWFVGDDLVQRVLAAGAAAAAVTGAVLLRSWDRKAGRRVAELTRARVRDEWRTEERIAELETDIEESRELRAALDTKLRAKRAELARLRSEHAELLRRYATAETERASALEGRRLLAIEASAPARELPAATGASRAPGSAGAPVPTAPDAPAPDRRARANRQVSDRQASDRQATAGRETSGRPSTERPVPAPTAAAYAQAAQALRQLARNAARQRAATERPTQPAPGGHPASGSHTGQDGDNGRGNGQAAAAQRTGGALTARTATAAGPALRPVPSAAAVAPSRPTASRTVGGFDFFGNATAPGPRQLPAPLEDDLADVVGDEALAEHSARTAARTAARTDLPGARTETGGAPEAGAAPATGERAAGDKQVEQVEQVEQDAAEPHSGAPAEGAQDGASTADGETTSGAGEVIDLTAHDETEQLDVGVLRTAIS
ncbi:hypothetical protein JK360_33055 [Streptomyces sp. 9-7]|uniref:Secreted protein n=1 Tax=Streptomyces siderophoricus TaxID=2802281 RepID=A0ABS1N221_9ACTN|nr:hypothetical protein [Streptomyces sp. 9-7]